MLPAAVRALQDMSALHFALQKYSNVEDVANESRDRTQRIQATTGKLDALEEAMASEEKDEMEAIFTRRALDRIRTQAHAAARRYLQATGVQDLAQTLTPSMSAKDRKRLKSHYRAAMTDHIYEHIRDAAAAARMHNEYAELSAIRNDVVKDTMRLAASMAVDSAAQGGDGVNHYPQWPEGGREQAIESILDRQFTRREAQEYSAFGTPPESAASSSRSSGGGSSGSGSVMSDADFKGQQSSQQMGQQRQRQRQRQRRLTSTSSTKTRRTTMRRNAATPSSRLASAARVSRPQPVARYKSTHRQK
jgi:hypothetical protein